MPTTRERLEDVAARLRAAIDVNDTKTMNELSPQVQALVASLKAGKTVSDLNERTGPFAAFGDDLGSETSTGFGWGASFVKNVESTYGTKSLVPSGSVVVPSLTAGITRYADRPRSILQLVPSTRLEGTDQYSFLRETVRTNNAAVVAVGALKPTSVYSVARVDDSVTTIAHLSEPIPRQTLADADLLRAYVEGSLREGVELELEDEILNGSGSGAHLEGIATVSGTQTQAFSSTMIDTFRKAVTKLETSHIDLSGAAFVLAPADWEFVELSKSSDGEYLVGDQTPVDRSQRRLWGVQVVTSTAVTAGGAYLVDFRGSTQLWERESVRVDWSENTYDPDGISAGVGASDFQRNMIRFRAEGRWGFAVTRPLGVVEIDTAA